MVTANPDRVNLAWNRNINVTYSEIRAARFETDILRDPSWHAFQASAYKTAYIHFIREGAKRLDILKKLSDISGATVKPGEHSEGSYAYCPAIGASIQVRSAEKSLQIVMRIAQRIAANFEITVRLASGTGKFAGQTVTLWWTPDAILE